MNPTKTQTTKGNLTKANYRVVLCSQRGWKSSCNVCDNLA